MSSVSEALAEQTPAGARTLLWVVALFVAIAIFWASWAELDEITRGDGEIIPSSQLQVVETLEGGAYTAIDKIYVFNWIYFAMNYSKNKYNLLSIYK